MKNTYLKNGALYGCLSLGGIAFYPRRLPVLILKLFIRSVAYRYRRNSKYYYNDQKFYALIH